jgi:hypothetical protein
MDPADIVNGTGMSNVISNALAPDRRKNVAGILRKKYFAYHSLI